MELARLLDSRAQQSESLRIETDVLRPQTISDNECVFNLRNTGVLDAGSSLIIPVCAVQPEARLTLAAGVYGLIQSATLQTSNGVVIAQTDESNYLLTINNSYVDPEKRLNVGTVTNGSQLNFKYVESGAFRGKLGWSCGDDVAPRFRLPSSADRSTGVEYHIRLSQLFPALLPFMLPLFVLKEGIQLRIIFTDPAVNGPRGLSVDAVQTKAEIGVINSGVRFVSDHLIFSEDFNSKIRALDQSANGIVIPYADFNTQIISHSAQPNPAAGTSTMYKSRRNIGLSNLRVRHMLIHTQEGGIGLATTTAIQKAGLGKYASSSGILGNELQLTVNSENYYPRTITSDSRLYNENADVYGIPCQVPQGLYSTTSSYIKDTAQNTQVAAASNIFDKLPSSAWSAENVFNATVADNNGQFQVLGVNMSHSRTDVFNTGTPIGKQQVEVEYNRRITTGRQGPFLQRIFCCVERLMVIKNGRIMTTNS